MPTNWTVAELRAKLKQKNVKGISRLNKPQLLVLWKHHRRRVLIQKNKKNSPFKAIIIKKVAPFFTKPTSIKKISPFFTVAKALPNLEKISQGTKDRFKMLKVYQKHKQHIILHGPCSVSKHVHAKWGMVVYVFGDVHTTYFSCPRNANAQQLDLTFLQAIEITARTLPEKFFDVHLEAHFQPDPEEEEKEPKGNEINEQGFLFGETAFSLRRKGYFDKKRQIKQIPNLRVHLDDVRGVNFKLTFHDRLWWFVRKYIDLIEINDEEPSVSDFIALANLIDQYSYEINIVSRWGNFNIDVKEIFTKTKIEKQLAKIHDQEILNVLNSWKDQFESNMKALKATDLHKVMQGFRSIKDDIQTFETLLGYWVKPEHQNRVLSRLRDHKPYGEKMIQPTTMKKIQDLAEAYQKCEQAYVRASDPKLLSLLINVRDLIDANILIQDLYMLARIMKQKQPNNIVYVGDDHAKNLRSAFSQMGFKEIMYQPIQSPPKQCLDLTALSLWPLF